MFKIDEFVLSSNFSVVSSERISEKKFESHALNVSFE